ncbi:MAG: hypothetical protein M3065_04085 [Actinomycetota bacterium]|nr:hypothetical protein [Actinomycetota bacterium]
MAVDQSGKLLTSTSPAGASPGWNGASIDAGGLAGVSCPSALLCVAVGAFDGKVWSSTDPAGGPATWRGLSIYRGLGDRFLTGVTCPSTALCLAYDNLGAVWTSSAPAGAGRGWHQATIEHAGPGVPILAGIGVPALTSVSCVSVRRCVAVDDGGQVLSSRHPTAGAGKWQHQLVDAPACAPATPCLRERLYVDTGPGPRVIDSAPPGSGRVISHVRLAPNSLNLHWTRYRQRRSLRLR